MNKRNKPNVEPYDLVLMPPDPRLEGHLTNNQHYRRPVEIISRPFLEPATRNVSVVMGWRVKVRLTPGDPTSLAEIGCDGLIPITPLPKYISFFETSGVGHFPLDMLRYDSMFLEDVNLLGSKDQFGDLAWRTKVQGTPTRLWKVATMLSDSQRRTDGRWASFLYTIRHVKSFRLSPRERNG